MGKFKCVITDFKFPIIAFIMAFPLHSGKVVNNVKVEVYETSAQGNSLKKINQKKNIFSRKKTNKQRDNVMNL